MGRWDRRNGFAELALAREISPAPSHHLTVSKVSSLTSTSHAPATAMPYAEQRGATDGVAMFNRQPVTGNHSEYRRQRWNYGC